MYKGRSMTFISDTVKFNHAGVKIIAHRGYKSVEIENTLQAFQFSSKTSAYGIETDVRLTGDGKFIVVHDGDLKRLAGIDGVTVENTSFDALRQIPLLNKQGDFDANYHLPTVEEYIFACKQANKQAILEIKEIDYENSKRLATLVSDLGYLDKTTFISFSEDSLHAVREVSPNQSVQLLVNDFDIALIPKLVINKWDLDIKYSALTKERIDALHELNVKVNCFTVNHKDVAELLVFWGVDMITSDNLE